MKPKIFQVTAIAMSQVKLLSKLNETLVKAGYEVHILCTNDEFGPQLKDTGVIIHEVNIDRTINPIGNLQSIIEMTKIFRRVKPDIVHVHTPVAAVLGRIAAKFSGIPHIIYTAHGFYFHDGMNKITYNLFYQIEKYVGRFFTDYIFTQSKEDFDLAVKGNFLKNNNYLHISNGIDLEEKFNVNNIKDKEIERLKAEFNINDEEVVFTFLGRMVREKGIVELLESFSILSKEYENIKLLCMGSLPESERDHSINALLNKYRENDQIRFLGQVEKPEQYYALSDIFILPSYREGMPRSIIEAMSLKNAIIATDIRGSREEVSHGENGYLVDVKSISDLVKSMRYLLENPKKIESMKERGYKKTIEEYDEKVVVAKQIDVFDQLLGR